MALFGINEEQLGIRLKELYQSAVSYVDGLFQPLSEKTTQLEAGMSNLEKKLESADAQLGNDVAKQNKTVEQLTQQLDAYQQRLAQLEQSQQRSGILSEAVKPKGEVTFEDVKTLAGEVSDAAYERIRGYFLLEMAKKGYEVERPDFAIWDKDSYLRIEFLVTNSRQIRVASDFVRGYKTLAYLENIPELKEGTAQRGAKEKVMFSTEGFDNSRDWFLLSVNSPNRNNWAEQLREDLPQMLQAYMLGYSLRCLDSIQRKEGGHMCSYDVVLNVQKKHDLKDNPALLERMREIMLKDPNLAAQFAAHYKQAE